MLDIVLVCTIIVVFLILFASEKLRVDLVAILLMVLLMVIGVFRESFPDIHEGISGFANEATVTIAAMFVLSAGLMKTGAISWISQRLARLGGDSEMRSFIILMVTVAFVSAFINNAAAVAVFIPITIKACRQFNVSPSRMLMPLSFISIMGGTCTLIGTSANILASALARDEGLEEFGMFELSPLGIVFFAVGLVYLIFVARRLLPERAGKKDLKEKYRLGKYITRLVVNEKCTMVGKTPVEADIAGTYDVTILKIIRGEEEIWTGLRDMPIQVGDQLLVRGSIEQIMEMNAMEGLTIRSEDKYSEEYLADEKGVIAEAVIAPSASLVGMTLKEADFRHKYGVFALAIQRQGESIRDKVGKVPLQGGDTLLLQGRPGFLDTFSENPDFLMLNELEVSKLRTEKAFLALGVIASVVLLAAFGVMPILVSALAGVMVMVLTGCINVQEAYDAIDWFVIFLLAGVIPLGIVMEDTGTAAFLANGIVQVSESLGPVAVISVFYLIATIFAAIMSHNAAIILLIPIGVASAQGMGLDARPFIMAITFAAASSLATPFGYHTNLMVYGPGGYKFADYMKIGIPLNVVLWIIASFLIPVFWPLVV
jgi:di/tricarboxylate transporter